MSTALNLFVNWSGWLFGLVGLLVSLDGYRKARFERKRSERIAEVLASREPVRPSLSVTSQRLASEAQLRSIIVHAAAGGQPVGVAVQRSKALSATADDVFSLVASLRDAGLLDFDGPLHKSTTLRLKE